MNRNPALPGLLHDLNNVFQTLVDAADRLSEDPQWRPISAAILRSVERGRRVTLSLQSNRGPTVPFQTILDNAIAFVEDGMLVARGPEFHFDCHVEQDIELPGSWAWERVLINLFLNSVRAMPEGGLIQVEAYRSGSEAVILVRDSGSGIQPGVLEHLFEPRVSTKPGGGLGLHVVKNIVQHYGGYVEAANRRDASGAVFTIALPLHLSARPAHASA